MKALPSFSLHLVRRWIGICGVAIELVVSVFASGWAGTAVDLANPFGMAQIHPEFTADAVGAGVKWTFAEVNWEQVEPSPGEWNWWVVDNFYYNFCEPNGFWGVIAVRTGACWATDTTTIDSLGSRAPGSDCPPLDYGEFYDLVYNLVDHLAGRINVFQVGVEPNLIAQWYGTSAEFLRLQETAYQAARAANPGAVVLAYQLGNAALGVTVTQDLYAHGDTAGAINYYNGFYNRGWADTVHTVQELWAVISNNVARRQGDMTRAFLDSAAFCDGVSLNFCAPYPVLETTVDWTQARLDSSAGHRPLWVMEWGIWDNLDVVSDSETAEELIKGYVLFFEEGIDRVRWYPLTVDSLTYPKDTRRAPLIDHDTRELLPGYYAYEALATTVGSLYLFDHRAEGSDPRVQRFLFRNDATGMTDLEIAWCDSCTLAVDLTQPFSSSRARVRDHLGQVLGDFPVLQGFLHLVLSHSPVFINWVWDPTAVGSEGSRTSLTPATVLRSDPNPFHGLVKITVRHPSAFLGERVLLGIYNSSGQRVARLEARSSAPGEYLATWDGSNVNGRAVATGVYFCRPEVVPGSPSLRLVLVH